MAKRKQFTFYRSYYEALQPLDPLEQAQIILAVCDYALNQVMPRDLSAAGTVAFSLIRPTLDAAWKKSQAGMMGGEANRKQTESKREARADKQTGSKTEANGKQTESKKEGENKGEREKEYEIEKENECYSSTPTPSSRQPWPF